MAGSDGAILMATARWSEEQNYLHEVIKRGDLPQMIRVVKGHYLGLGVPSLANPNLSSTAVVTSAGPCVRVAVQCVKFKDNHRTVNVGPKLAIPDTFDGYFEILNEDGKAVKCIESVAELTRRFPDSCLVRENIKGYISRSDNVESITERSRTIAAGELLVLVGEVAGSGPSTCRNRFLRCFDSRGEHIYLPLDGRGKFSAIAKEDNISGVHNIRNLLNKRLPLMVRMVSGRAPVGLKMGQQFTHEMRLLARFEEDMIVALPVIKSDHPVVVIPASVSLKLQLPVNGNNIKQSKEFLRIHDRCLQKYHEMADNIQVYDANFSKNLRFDGQQWKVPVVPLLRRSTNDLLNMKDLNSTSTCVKEPLVEESAENKSASPVPPEYDEIDQIYDYIRGFAPLPKHIRNSYDILNGNVETGSKNVDNRNLYNRAPKEKNNKRSTSATKPVPPPLETIPSRKMVQSTAKETAGSHPAAVVRSSPVPTRHSSTPSRKSTSQQEAPAAVVTTAASKPRIFRQRSAIPMRNGLYKAAAPTLLSPAESKQSLTPSPLFNIRYKSMTNLLTADSDTLGSSQSGGRCSGGSAGSAAVRSPPHYMRQSSTPVHHHHHPHLTGQVGHLHRPRSLTDLLWDVRPGKSPPKIQLHPTVVADVIPQTRNQRVAPGQYITRSAKHEQIIRRRNSANLISGSTNVSSGGGSSKKQQHNTIFYHL